MIRPPKLAVLSVPLLFGLLYGSAIAAQPVTLVEVARQWGLEFKHHHGGSGRYFMQETTAGGVILFDFDDDGDTDLFFVDGGPLPGYEGEAARSKLFRNEGDGHFKNFTHRSGILVSPYGCGGSAGDIDGDGDFDLYVTQSGANQLFRNNGDGSFTDTTTQAAVGGDRYSTSAAFADTDRDGDLDLYVVNYLDYPLSDPTVCRDDKRDIVAYCHPTIFPAEPDRFYRNRGDGTFEDRSEAAGFLKATGNGLGLVIADFDNDRWPDLYVANDSTPNFLFLNRGDGTFEDQSLLSGTAYGDRTLPEAGMGVAVGDVDGNGFLDIMVTNYALETNALYRNFGNGIFADARHIYGVAEPSIIMLGFGASFADFDQDGSLDLVIANGHIQDKIETIHPGLTFAQRNQLLVNDGQGRLIECLDCGLDEIRVSRALATGDLDGDGDLDLVVVNANDEANAYENKTSSPGRWLQVDATVGTRLTLTMDATLQIREVRTSSSYQSQNSMTAHFGLGTAEGRPEIRVDPPIGRSRIYKGLVADRRYRLMAAKPGSGS